MILPLFAIYDSKALIFLQPYPVANAELAIRAFTQAVNDPSNSDLHNFPSDFSLIEVASYDNDTGVITPINHVNHGTGSQFIAHSKPAVKSTKKVTK